MLIYQASPHAHRALGVLRIAMGLLFLSEGTMKWFGFPPGPAGMPHATVSSLVGVAGLIEIVGGLSMMVGLLTRPWAFLLAGEMAVAYFYAHFPHGFFPTTNNGMPAVLFCFIFLYFSFAGGGAWSIDDALSRVAMRPPDVGHLPSLWPSRRLRAIARRGR